MENIGGLGNPSFDLKLQGPTPQTIQTLLKINQVLQGEVIQLLDGQSLVLGVGQFRIPAQSHVELRLGQKFSFRVEEQGQEIVFKILDQGTPAQEPGAFELFQKSAAKDEPIAQVFGKLAQLLVALSEGSKATPGKTPSTLQNQAPILDRQTLSFLKEIANSAALAQKMEFAQQNVLPTTVSSPNTLSPSLPQILPSTIPNALPNPTTVLPTNILSETVVVQIPNSTTQTSANPVSIQTPPSVVPESIPVLLPQVQELVTPNTQPTQTTATRPEIPLPAVPGQVANNLEFAALESREKSAALLAQKVSQFLPMLKGSELSEKVTKLAQYLESNWVHGRANEAQIRRGFEELSRPVENRILQFLDGKEPAQTMEQPSLKSLILNLEREFEQAKEFVKTSGDHSVDKAFQEFSKDLKGAREAIESKQLQNALRQENGQALHFQIPFQDGKTLRTMEFFYEKSQDKKSKKAPGSSVHHVVFLLEMSQLGRMRVDALLRSKKIDLRFHLHEEKAAQYLEKQLPELASALQSYGYELGVLECRSTKKDLDPAREDNSWKLPVSSERHLLDLEG